MTTEVKTLIEDLGRTFDSFKKTHSDASTAMEQKFADNLNTRIGELEDAIDAKLASANRTKASDELGEALERKAALASAKSFAQKGGQAYFADTLDTKSGYDVTTDANGKFGVPKVIDGIVAKQVREGSALRSLITIKTIGTSAYNGLVNLNNATAGNVAETGTRTATSANTFAQKTINVHEMYANPAVTLQMLEDVQFDPESELFWSVGEALAALENSDWVVGTGDGDKKATGFLTVSQQDITAGALGAHDKLNTIDGSGDLVIVSHDIINLQDALPAQFAANGTFVMSRKYRNAIRKLQDENDNYLWQPSYQAGVPSTLCGSPVVVLADMPTAATANTLPIVFADFKNWYYGVDRVGLSILRDPYTVEGSVVFKFRKRQGGGLFNGRAGVALKLKDIG